jgi:hypothetical protein
MEAINLEELLSQHAPGGAAVQQPPPMPTPAGAAALLARASRLVFGCKPNQLNTAQLAGLRQALSSPELEGGQAPDAVSLPALQAAVSSHSGTELAEVVGLLAQLRSLDQGMLQRASDVVYGRPIASIGRQQLRDLVRALATAGGAAQA